MRNSCLISICRLILLVALFALALSSAGCANLSLVGYRDDAFLKSYTYTLGENYITVDGLRYCYQEMGEGETVLILPGIATSIDFWQYAVEGLSKQYHVVALDPPGIGKSDKPDASYTLQWLLDHIVAFMDAKGIRRTHVVGGSLGGHLALMMAIQHPDRVSKLVLQGTVGNWPTPTGLTDFALRNVWNEPMVVDVMRWRWPDMYATLFKHPNAMTERIFRYQMALRADGGAYAPEGRMFTRAFKNIFYSSVRDKLGRIDCPALLIWGAEDTTHSPENGRYFLDHMKDAKLVIIKDAAHEVMVDQPHAFNDTVLDFLKNGTGGMAGKTTVIEPPPILLLPAP